jgi:hypothetical protein
MNETLDRILPGYRQREVHAITLAAPPERAWAALLAVTPAELPLTRALMAVRALPALLAGRGRALAMDGSAPVIDRFLRNGWLVLADEPGRALVAGLIARFWEPVPKGPAPVRDAAEFAAFREPGFAKAVTSFEVLPDGAGSRLVTETRVEGTDASARRLFALYWLVIRPGSGLIRRSLLQAVRRRCAEAA